MVAFIPSPLGRLAWVKASSIASAYIHTNINIFRSIDAIKHKIHSIACIVHIIIQYSSCVHGVHISWLYTYTIHTCHHAITSLWTVTSRNHTHIPFRMFPVLVLLGMSVPTHVITSRRLLRANPISVPSKLFPQLVGKLR